MIRLESVSKSYGQVRAVEKLSLHVEPGELFGFLGPNGAGKTTTIKMIAGLLRPSEGRILLAGHDLERDPLEAKRALGFIPDRPFLYEKLNAAEFLRFVAGIYGLSGSIVDTRIRELLVLVELSRVENELVESFSHGMRQRLAMASAFVHDPMVLVVDEPMVGLDPKGARLIKRLFRDYCDRGRTVFVSTHTLEVAQELCDRIGIIVGGKLIACGNLDELKRLAQTSEHDLEAIFMKLTGGTGLQEVEEVLD